MHTFGRQPLINYVLLHRISDTVNLEAKMCTQQNINLFVHTIDDKTITMQLKPGDTVATLKMKICEHTGIPMQLQKLFLATKHLNDDLLIKYIDKDSNITMKVGLLGGSNECDVCFSPGSHVCMQCSGKVFCSECCIRFHKHPQRNSHSPQEITISSSISTSYECQDEELLVKNNEDDILSEREYDSTDSPNTYAAFAEAPLVVTLAERFGLTRFKKYQQLIINAILDGNDCLVIQPTGSGKSLCFQFPPIHENKKAVIITPTISLMQDHVTNANEIGLNAIYLGSAQLDTTAEERAFSEEHNVQLIYVTPEWLSKESNKAKVHALARDGRLSLIALDEAHLLHYWQKFRVAYKTLENLTVEFPQTPLVFLTATAPPPVKHTLTKLLRDPVVSQASVDRPNIYLTCEEIPATVERKDFSYFAMKVASLLDHSECAIIYTDFIDDVGPIMNALHSHGLDSVAYYGEMDAKSRRESYDKWRSGETNIMVATSAFGMGINKANIRHIIRFGVPENMCGWAQEIGRAGRDGKPATATIFYQQCHIEHAGTWIRGSLSDIAHCQKVLDEFSQSWKYVTSDLAGKCRRVMLLELFGEEKDASLTPDISQCCCDVCNYKYDCQDCTEELRTLYSAMEMIGAKGELKLSQWIRGSSLAWTNDYNKRSTSYGKSLGHSEKWWRIFIRKCHVLGLVEKRLQSIIKRTKHYSVQGIIHSTEKGIKLVQTDEHVVSIPQFSEHMEECYEESLACSKSTSIRLHSSSHKICRERKGKGTHAWITAKRLLEDKENWNAITSKSDYHFPGQFSTNRTHAVLYTPDCMELPQASSDSSVHYLWNDIQISKGSWNKDREVQVKIGDTNETLMYRSSPCNGVKLCPGDSCDYVAPVSAQRPCLKHPTLQLVRSNATQPCPVVFAYAYPKNVHQDHRRWLLVFRRHTGEANRNIHNHIIHSSTRICTKVKEMIADATTCNQAIKPSQISKGQGIGVIPGAIDGASNHSGKIRREVHRAKQSSISGLKWHISEFKDVANEIDSCDERLAGDIITSSRIKKMHRPYMVAAGFEDNINFIMCMSPLMASVLSQAEFVEADITYNETKEYKYLFNLVAFNDVTMEWIVVSRVRMDCQGADAYALAFRKTFEKCKLLHPDFEPGRTLKGIVLDWSDAEICGLRKAVGKDTADQLLRGCSIHWARSWQRVRDKVCKCTSNRDLEKKTFSMIAASIQKLSGMHNVKLCFEVLCSQQPLHKLKGIVKGLSPEDASFLEKHCDWSLAKKWVEWWMRPCHLSMLHKDFSSMDEITWTQCPNNTNAVERKNFDSKESTVQSLRNAMINLYKLDKAVCAKHLTAQAGASVSYNDKSDEGRQAAAVVRSRQRQKDIPRDLNAMYGPPDKHNHFEKPSRKRLVLRILSSQSYTLLYRL